ncbi:uncharacterized protein LOC115243984 [Formica exsecta]|uniref:uncharacterized protein LOC115243984 n=1 Tax=Formica exsecta TaxID=72781 RepID=UPI001143F5C3|nr:uncharacterized protein LOC115243984 [Formica exsecta]
MYRQIHTDARDIDYQRILWKSSLSEPLIDYQLLTVTFGMSCAPFLALRVLKQFVIDEGQHFQFAVSILSDNIYVDDLLYGADDTIRIRQACDQLNSMLKRGGFVLRKWASNSPSLLEDIEIADHGLATNKPLAEEEQIKILGIGWNPANDIFEFRVSLADNAPETKRTILSAIAKFYDPLGWVTPVTITAKIFMQQLWRLKSDWDNAISELHIVKWREIYSRLSYLNNLRIIRWIGRGSDTSHAEIHGFADASTHAYAACVYIKIISSLGQITTTLLVGKLKVAPLKSLSIPRLELSAALLLARLVEFVRGSNGYKDIPCHCWTDSTIVLAWVSQPPSRWKTFVANRVNDIQTRLPDVEWRHVSTEDNPADCASREIFGDEIINRELWWHGPPWLLFDSDKWPCNTERLPEEAPLEEKDPCKFGPPLDEGLRCVKHTSRSLSALRQKQYSWKNNESSGENLAQANASANASTSADTENISNENNEVVMDVADAAIQNVDVEEFDYEFRIDKSKRLIEMPWIDVKICGNA